MKGLNILSSALGSVRADTGWCKEKDLFVCHDIIVVLLTILRFKQFK